jgi:hypothetical protein
MKKSCTTCAHGAKSMYRRPCCTCYAKGTQRSKFPLWVKDPEIRRKRAEPLLGTGGDFSRPLPVAVTRTAGMEINCTMVLVEPEDVP